MSFATDDTAAPPVSGGRFLTFFLGDEEYGVEILRVQEIIGMQPITRVPRTPAFVRGVINLRGRVIPIVELRERFEMPAADDGDELASALRCIIVSHVRGPLGATMPIGLAVDRVSEVATIADADVEPAPSFGAHVQTGYLRGLGKVGGRVKLLLDIDRVLAAEELDAVATVDVGASPMAQ